MPRREKTCLLGLRPGPTQTGLNGHRRRLGAWNFRLRKSTDCSFYLAKTKALISSAFTVLAYAKNIFLMVRLNLSLVMRKPAFCRCENKDADQLRGNHEADQRLCFRYIDRTIPPLPKYEISSFQLSSATVHPGLCMTWSETPKTGCLRTRLICYQPLRGEIPLQPDDHLHFQTTLELLSCCRYSYWIPSHPPRTFPE